MPRLDELPPERVADAVAKAVVDAVNQGGDTEAIVARALARVKRELMFEASGPSPTPSPNPPATLAAYHPAPMGSRKSVGGYNGSGRPLITEADVIAACRSGQTELRVAPGTIVTALARDAARDGGLRLVEG